ncbi:MAG: hypothetical protein ACM3ZQ_11910 [Bacillota bacterium]
MARMEFVVNEHAAVIKAEGKIPHLMAKETLGPGELFMGGIGG